MKSTTTKITLPENTHRKMRDYARHIGCVSTADKPKVTTAIWRSMRMLLNLYSDEECMEKVKQEGGDVLAFIERCVKKEIRKSQ